MVCKKGTILSGALIIGLISFLSGGGICYGQQIFSGMVDGDFEATTSAGIVVSGAIEGRWEVRISQNEISATASGTFGGASRQAGQNAGISGTWTGRVNPDGRTISGEWQGPGEGGGGAGGTIALTLDLATGRASGEFSGRIPSNDGFQQVSGTWTVSFPVVEDLSSPRGRITGGWTGEVAGNVSGSIQSPIGTIPINIPFSTTATGELLGEWSAAFSGEFLTGTAQGEFNGSAAVAVNTPIGSTTVEVPITGNFLGALNCDLRSGVRYEGGWTAISTPGRGVSPGFGGPFSFTVDVSGGAPFNASGTFGGGGSFQQAGLTVTYSVVGDWQVQLSLE